MITRFCLKSIIVYTFLDTKKTFEKKPSKVNVHTIQITLVYFIRFYSVLVEDHHIGLHNRSSALLESLLLLSSYNRKTHTRLKFFLFKLYPLLSPRKRSYCNFIKFYLFQSYLITLK